MYNKIYDDISNFELKKLGNKKNNKIKVLNKLGIKTLLDLIYFFPRTYEDKAKLKKISELRDGENVIIVGKLHMIQTNYFSGKKMVKAKLLDENNGIIELVWFNNKYISKQLIENSLVRVTGKVRKSRFLQIVNPLIYKVKNSDNIAYLEDTMGKDAIYPLTSGITQKQISDIIEEAINKYMFLFDENLPKEYIVQNKLIDRKKAIINMHFPKSKLDYEESVKRFIYEESLLLEMKILKNRYLESLNNTKKYSLNDNRSLVKKYISGLPFELTSDQKKVITNIYKELNDGKIINRLIQGDVGSGKTVVSLILLLYMVENGYQGVIMAPTEILASQHYLDVVEKFKELDVKVELLTSSVKGKKKKEIYENILNGDVDIVIGTHSLIEDELEFKNLGLIIIDEQHKFGVDQRNKIRDKGMYANLIVMSATPIPRSLALTIYGDLDVSIISTKPVGRKPIKTKWIKNEKELTKMYNFIDSKIKEGRQVYVVSPLIENSEKLNLSSAMETQVLYNEIFPQYTIGLLHGKLKSKEKEEVMNSFNKGEIDILVSTTVVEVGVNVANASVIVILSAERFGLSSLHQLRGRVGRSSHDSYCLLVSNTTNDVSKERLTVMENTNDGFKIAEEDLRLRDTGEIFGIKQSGLSELKLVDIIKNIKEISIAKSFCENYLSKNKGEIIDDNLKIDVDRIY
ncbi:ATP-dependent DNA helicase RecG [Pseudostreptobacillus hongkongensis]|uniref:ATP-dependent DNA helicase RecG n=1 Tax=Pseudostreptobacillus hongkongensis TaxID=1162717 RepID=UPI00082EF09A|nr:ATP-dependent DNA helicase RecG [Pseudostreptobacillus hongkongensis]